MKPLATPVIGGMVSSLLHILIVTPVIFAWLRERDLKNPAGPNSSSRDDIRVPEAPALAVEP
jgi:hypothetical protein